MKIYVKNNNVDKAMRVLKRKLLLEGDTNALKDKRFFVSKSEKKRLIKKAGRKRWLHKQKESHLFE